MDLWLSRQKLTIFGSKPIRAPLSFSLSRAHLTRDRALGFPAGVANPNKKRPQRFGGGDWGLPSVAPGGS